MFARVVLIIAQAAQMFIPVIAVIPNSYLLEDSVWVAQAIVIAAQTKLLASLAPLDTH